jgi:LemA protein
LTGLLKQGSSGLISLRLNTLKLNVAYPLFLRLNLPEYPMSSGLIFLVVLALFAIFGVFMFNQLVALKHNVGKAWANIDILLKQRHDELPKLVETCKQYMKFEQETLEKVMQARSQVASARESQNIPALSQAEGALRLGLGNLFAVAEAYPELKTNETFQHLQARISGLENALADRREFYNDTVNVNNVRVEQFPDTVIARLFDFRQFPLLRFASEEKKDVDLKQLFTS